MRNTQLLDKQATWKRKEHKQGVNKEFIQSKAYKKLLCFCGKMSRRKQGKSVGTDEEQKAKTVKGQTGETQRIAIRFN
jgi:hypothetical protein